MNIVFRQLHNKFLLALGLIITFGVPIQANAYVISTDQFTGTPTEGWDGPGIGAATIDYYLGWSGAPSNNGLDFGAMGLGQVENELANAMATWSAVADITFNYLGNAVSTPGLAVDPWGSAGNETLVIYSHGQEAANQFPFDGPGLTTVFAHAFGPPDIPSGFSYAFAGNIHMDADENWIYGLADGVAYTTGIDLETIFLHELGHSLGLAHTGGFATPGGPVMANYSNLALSTLGADDINGLRQLYSFQGQDWSNGDPGTQCVPGDPTCDPNAMPVPEPGTLFLLGAGLIAIAGVRRRKLSAAP